LSKLSIADSFQVWRQANPGRSYSDYLAVTVPKTPRRSTEWHLENSQRLLDWLAEENVRLDREAAMSAMRAEPA
jgi:hypothetical protein